MKPRTVETQYDGEIEELKRSGADHGRLRFLKRSRAALLRNREAAARKVNEAQTQLIEAAVRIKLHKKIDAEGPKSWAPDEKAKAMLAKYYRKMLAGAVNFRARLKK